MTGGQRVSIIVPTRNSGRTLASCVRSIVTQLAPGDEAVVVDNHSVDETQDIARGLGASVLVAGPERSAQRNVGLEVASGEIVIFVDSDMTLEPGLIAEIRGKFDQDAELSALVIPERSFGSGYWSSIKQFERDLFVGDPTVEAARAFRRGELEAMGGWNEALLGPEDWELTDRYRAKGKKVSRTERRIWHDEGDLRLATLYRKKRYYARGVQDYMKSAPHRRSGLISRYASAAVAKEMLRHPIKASGLVIAKSAEAVGALQGIRATGTEGDSVYGAVKL